MKAVALTYRGQGTNTMPQDVSDLTPVYWTVI